MNKSEKLIKLVEGENFKITKSLGCDTANISIITSQFVAENGGEFGETAKEMCVKVVSPNSAKRYEYILTIEGKKITGTLDAAKEYYLGDTCYYWSDVEHGTWLRVLEKTGYFERGSEDYGYFDLPGDGEYKVTLELNPIEGE
jgi:hypothetical protein